MSGFRCATWLSSWLSFATDRDRATTFYTEGETPTAWEALEFVTISAESNEIKVTNCNYNDSISRQAAIDAVGSMLRRKFGIGGDLAEITLAELPSAQPEIIRCKDCKHYYYADNRIPQEQRYSCDLDGDRWKPEDFCSYAERRGEQDE